MAAAIWFMFGLGFLFMAVFLQVEVTTLDGTIRQLLTALFLGLLLIFLGFATEDFIEFRRSRSPEEIQRAQRIATRKRRQREIDRR